MNDPAQFRLPQALVRAVLITNILAGVAYWTTHFPPVPLIAAFFVAHVLLLTTGIPPAVGRFSPAFCCLGFLIYGISQVRDGLPSIIALANFTVGILVVQSMLLRDIKAAYQCLILSAMIVLAAGAMNVNFLFPLGLAPYVVFLTASLFLIGRFSQARQGQAALGEGQAFPTRFALQGVLLVAASWLGLFYLFPRSDVFGYSSMAGQKRLMGFSDTLKLGDVGTLLENSTIVMRVRPISKEPISPQMVETLEKSYLRGVSFHSYRKGEWVRSDYGAFPVNMRRNGGELRIRTYPDDPRPNLVLEILLENTDPPVLFLPNNTQLLTTDIPYLTMESDGAITFMQRRTHMEIYKAQIKLGREDLRTPPSAEEPFFPPFLRQFLEVGDLSLQVQELAQDLVRGPASETVDLMGKIQAVQRHLRRNCEYSLEETTPPGIRDPVAYFLFQSRQGSCEHFASAMVLLLRSLGIPARPVNGYVLEEWNDFGEYFTVRQSHAHSWVEVYLPDHGWTTFDPTPAARQAGDSSLFFLQFQELWNWFEAFWLEYVYSFNRQMQAKGFRVLKQRFQLLVKTPERLFAFSSTHVSGLLVVLTLGIGLGYLAWRRRQGLRSTPGSWIPAWYRDWEPRLPLPRQTWETPREFHGRLARDLHLSAPALPLLDEIAQAVDEAAFSPHPTPPPQAAMKAFLETFCQKPGNHVS